MSLSKTLLTILTFATTLAAVSHAEEQPSPSSLSKVFSAEQIKAIEDVFVNFLKRKPETIESVLQESAVKKEAEKQARLKEVIAENKKAIFDDPDSPVGGNKRGATNLVVFADPYCGYCHRFISVLKEVSAKDQDLRIIYKDLPILGEESTQAVQEALAAHQQGKYEAYREAISNAKADSRNVRLGVAEAAGINVDRLQSDMESSKIQAAVARTKALAQKLDIQGTPAFVVGDIFVGGYVDASTLMKILAQVRKN